MFSRDFYPTPPQVIEQMCASLDLVGKTILEPSAGSGNIVSWLQQAGANVLACEIHPDLAKIVAAKCRFLKNDFFSVQESDVSHVDFIIMNPPFSADENHILHAWNVAPPGCEIISLCNMNTIENLRYTSREKLSEIITGNGFSQNMGPVFSSAEHKTDVPVGLVHLYKPRVNGKEFDGYFDTFDDADNDNQQNGLMSYNEVRNIVNRYVGAVKMFDSVIEKSSEINKLMAPINDSLNISFGAFYCDRRYFSEITRDVFKNELQKSAWKSVFNKFNMRKYVTQSVISELNAFVEKQSNVPFTMSNVYKMIEMIIGTHRDRMDRILVHAFDEICSHSADNSTAGEKWKTNSNYKVNLRFIIPYMTRYENWHRDTTHILLDYSAKERIDDIIKALCYLTGTPYENIGRLSEIEDITRWGEWAHWAFFRVRGYKKGTMHFEFVDEKVWELFNRRVAEIKGWQIPRKTDKKTKGTEHIKPEDLILFNN